MLLELALSNIDEEKLNKAISLLSELRFVDDTCADLEVRHWYNGIREDMEEAIDVAIEVMDIVKEG